MRPSRQAQAGCGISTVTLRFRASDGSSVDMKAGLRELTALSLLAAFCCGLAWAHDDTFFAAVFDRNHDYRGDTAFTVSCRRSAQPGVLHLLRAPAEQIDLQCSLHLPGLDVSTPRPVR